MRDIVNQFIIDKQGQFIEVSDRNNIYQCLDLVYDFLTALRFPKDTIRNLYAYQAFTSPKAITKEYFDLIPNTPDFIPQDGDIGVFNKTSTNIAGHIGICLSGGSTSKFPFFEQNAPLGSNAHITPNKSYTNFLGVLRAKRQFFELIINDQTKLPIIDSNGNQMEVGSVRSKIADQEMIITRQIEKIETLNGEISALQEKLDKASQNASQCVTEDSNYTVTVPVDSFQASTQNTKLNLCQKIVGLIKKLLELW